MANWIITQFSYSDAVSTIETTTDFVGSFTELVECLQSQMLSVFNRTYTGLRRRLPNSYSLIYEIEADFPNTAFVAERIAINTTTFYTPKNLKDRVGIILLRHLKVFGFSMSTKVAEFMQPFGIHEFVGHPRYNAWRPRAEYKACIRFAVDKDIPVKQYSRMTLLR